MDEKTRMECILRSVSCLRLTPKKQIILREVDKMSGKTTLTSAVDRISRELAMPYSTVKWNLMKLRACGLINAGSKERQSIPMVITEAGSAAVRLSEEAD